MSWVLIEDTRNQVGKHKNIEAYCEKTGIRIVRHMLPVGDYIISNRGGISVDTKYGVPELASCCFQEHERFRDEIERARDYGIQLVVLTEEKLPGGLLENWRSPTDRYGRPMYRFDPAKLKKTMLTMQEKYGVKFRFCDGRSTGKVLLGYLQGELE